MSMHTCVQLPLPSLSPQNAHHRTTKAKRAVLMGSLT